MAPKNTRPSDVSVRDSMSSPVITIKPDSSLLEASKLMRDKDIGAIIVLDGAEAVGIVTEHDFVIFVSNGTDINETKVGDVMSSPLFTISPDSSIIDAAKFMGSNKIRKLPVVENNQLKGIITSEDIAKIAPAELELLMELVSIKFDDVNEYLRETGSGECENCSNFAEEIVQVDDKFLCRSCARSSD
ncbi:TPA: CBS domain-containing protein [archaeon]|nr:CBS domain-containing protein [Candidatus Undinarchaeales archaeon SRR5007147.bin71]